jgi:dUTP pyrophosphatase
VHIIFDRIHEDARIPTRATEGSAGYDLAACLSVETVRFSDGTTQWDESVRASSEGSFVEISPAQMALVPLGFRARLPAGYEAQIRPRSGAAFRNGLHVANSPGTIDCDYPGEWMVPVRNGGAATLRITHGDRIAQVVFSRFEVLEFEGGEVGVTSSRTAGFGSTGR